MKVALVYRKTKNEKYTCTYTYNHLTHQNIKKNKIQKFILKKSHIKSNMQTLRLKNVKASFFLGILDEFF